MSDYEMTSKPVKPAPDGKRWWYEIHPTEVTEITLPQPDIQGPYDDDGNECPWPWEPIQLRGQPIGMYHCRYCLSMVLAGEHHVDYGPRDEHGMNQLDYALALEEKEAREAQNKSDD